MVLAREEDRELRISELKAKCNRASKDVEKNSIVQYLRVNTMKLASQPKEARAECGRLKMEEAKVIGLREILSILESKCAGLKSEKTRLVDQKSKLRQE